MSGAVCDLTGARHPDLVERRVLDRLVELLVQEHRRAVAELGVNWGGHLGIREDWSWYDEDTEPEPCEVCDAILAAQAR